VSRVNLDLKVYQEKLALREQQDLREILVTQD
jgi:hypothetical protein